MSRRLLDVESTLHHVNSNVMSPTQSFSEFTTGFQPTTRRHKVVVVGNDIS
jgi:hypothetical protein